MEPSLPILNWREIALLLEKIRLELAEPTGIFVEKIVVPERPRFPEGYLKGEWAIRLSGKKSLWTLIFSIRPRHPYLILLSGKGPAAAALGTRSAFDLTLSKHLSGSKLLDIEALPRERIVILWFSGTGASRLGLVIALIPAVPEALLIREDRQIISRSRITDEKNLGPYTPPDGRNAPAEPNVRDKLLVDSVTFRKTVEKSLDAEAFALRLRAYERFLKDLLKQAKDRLRQASTSLQEARKEPDWRRYGDLLKGVIGNSPQVIKKNGGHFLQVHDFETSQDLEIPCDPKLSLQDQLEKFYQFARRKLRRAEEAQSRIAELDQKAALLEKNLRSLPATGDWASLEKAESKAGIRIVVPTKGERPAKKGIGWLGKSFQSREGLTILVGRNKTENLELTFKHARGNDLWMHIRGRPGAHVIIPLPSGKSASLETLLDAAHLAIHYSGGDSWGKTEVDYTFKKYVKRIKDSTEASYTNNKTLIVEPDPARIKKLLESV